MTLGSQHSPLFALVQETLRKRILSGAYAQGERLVEGDLAEEMGVSRIPVRGRCAPWPPPAWCASNPAAAPRWPACRPSMRATSSKCAPPSKP